MTYNKPREHPTRNVRKIYVDILTNTKAQHMYPYTVHTQRKTCTWEHCTASLNWRTRSQSYPHILSQHNLILSVKMDEYCRILCWTSLESLKRKPGWPGGLRILISWFGAMQAATNQQDYNLLWWDFFLSGNKSREWSLNEGRIFM